MLSISPPPALPAHVVTLLLSYISSLDCGLPPHLLSTPLRQRHTFLGLGATLDTAEDAAAYLSWPGQSSDDVKMVAELLADLPSAESFDPLVAYDTKYSFDGDAVYAHANVPINTIPMANSKGLRLIFRWETSEEDGVEQHQATNVNNWKYHDAKPMPFPSSIHDTLDEVCDPEMAQEKLSARISIQSEMNGMANHGPAEAASGVNLEGKEDDDDDYWNSYGRSDSDSDDEDEGEAKRSLSAGIPRSNSKISDDGKAEDAYWAQYASVHGSADSTRPSPLPQRRKLHDPNQPLPGSATSSYFDRLEPAVHRDNLSRSESDDRLDARGLYFTSRRELLPGEPCPEVLTRRLYAASPRPTRSPSPVLPAVAEDAVHLQEMLRDGTLIKEMENEDDTEDFEVLGSPGTSEGRTLTPPGPLIIEEQPSPKRFSKSKSQSPINEIEKDADVALRESIKGLYTLWTMRRDVEGLDAEGKERFLVLVKDVLDTTQ